MELKSSGLMLLTIPYLLLFVIAARNVKPVKIHPKNSYIIIIVLLFSSIFLAENLIHGRLIRKGIPQTAKALVSFADEIKTYKALKKRKVTKHEVDFKTSELEQQTFVLIIGESCNRNHMSLYNYAKKTNPKLEQRNDIIVFNNVVSPYSNTLGSVLSALTESNLENKMGFDKSVSLIDIFHSINFKTFWLSNQSPIGIWDNAIYNLAQTSDVSIFVNNAGNTSFESTYLSSYDERLFGTLHTALKDDSQNKFIVIHLMGSHSAYSKRYPPDYDVFTSHTNNKEQLINAYDNSILYNDFIVDSMFNILSYYSSQTYETISSCIYFSDHGENVYDENDNAGHDYSGSMPKSNVEIPFIVWLSTEYKNKFSEKNSAILSNTDLPFVSDDLFHAVLDLNDITSKIYSKNRSLFNPDFNAERRRILEDNMDYDLK
ncbi:MAG: phosphoethanolamine transferase [Bacteroidales bacterium]|nr:phosphoethanolamine transferase [Bacteroidales bacterium]